MGYHGHMSRRDNVLVRHREAIREIAAQRKAKSIALVGSVDRGEGSDYDFLVEPASRMSTFDVGALIADLEEILGEGVDVSLRGRKFEQGRCLSMLDDAIPL